MFHLFQMDIANVASRSFKTRSSVASLSCFSCLSSMSDAGSKHRRRRSPLTRGGPHVLKKWASHACGWTRQARHGRTNEGRGAIARASRQGLTSDR
jgi:hypothetical protein